jgi:membrane protein implicated in regulation of membrane protease activity
MVLQSDFFGPNTLPLLLTAAGLVLSIMEALAPGANFIVVGVALLAAGLVGLAFTPLASPFVLGFLILAFGAAAFYVYRDLGLYDVGDEQTTDSSDLTGSTAHVTERVTPTEGEVKVDGGGFNPYFSARSMEGEIPEGTEVLVVDPGGGNVLTVESLDADTDEIDRELARERARTERSGDPNESTAVENRNATVDDEREPELN